MSTVELMRWLQPETRLIIVGDAHMAPYELTSPFGSIDYWHQNDVEGIRWLQRLERHFSKAAWLNPIPRRYWGHPTIQMIGSVFSMHELTLAGLDAAIADLH